ncbi:MAG: ferredoxin, partial [Mycobacteriaceae bacterium]|nr:ferredoxin [Mycobacteriaceae bacterium]
LAECGIQEVVVVGRRGLRDAAFSVGEFLALGNLAGVDVLIDTEDVPSCDGYDVDTAHKIEIAHEYACRPATPGNKRIIFLFDRTPIEVVGNDRAAGLRVQPTGDLSDDGRGEVVDACLIITAIGYRAPALPEVPHDAERGVIPNDNGRVLNEGAVVPGVYVTGWIKRGPRGVIGTNRNCAAETVAQLLRDFDAGALDRVTGESTELDRLLTSRGASPLTWEDWRAIDAAERQRGEQSSRPRVKFTSRDDMLGATET